LRHSEVYVQNGAYYTPIKSLFRNEGRDNAKTARNGWNQTQWVIMLFTPV